MSYSAQRYQPRAHGSTHIDPTRLPEARDRTLSRKARRRAKSALMFLCMAFPAEVAV